MTLNGIDISNHKDDLDLRRVDFDFMITKATEGTGFVDWCFREFMDTAIDMGKLVGAYHFARTGDAREQAEFFVDTVRDYVGRATLWLDWETQESAGDHVRDQGPEWALEWLDAVYELTGTRPGIYTGKSATHEHDYTCIVDAGYPLWGAQYASNDPQWGYDGDPWQSGNPWGAWGWDVLIHQYSSQGILDGYGGRLDLDLLHGTEADWNALIGKDGSKMPKKKKVVHIDVANVQACIHADMCEDDANGYSWDPRHGEDGPSVKTVWVDGLPYYYDPGSMDCSSSVIIATNEALRYTKYKNALLGANTTHDMRRVFVESGLYEVWDTQTTNAVRGDVYLKDDEHTAMCQDGGDDGVYGYDCLSEFSGSENGDVYNNQTGDQTGYEAWIHGYYDDNWYCTLHYNGAADCDYVVEDGEDEGGRHEVCVWPSHGKMNQRWKLRKKGTDKKGAYYAIQNVADKHYLDVAGADNSDGAEVILWHEFNGGRNQLWRFVEDGKSPRVFRIESMMKGGRVLDVRGASDEDGAGLCIWPRKDADASNQQWAVLKNADGTRTIVNNGAGAKRVLDAAGQA